MTLLCRLPLGKANLSDTTQPGSMPIFLSGLPRGVRSGRPRRLLEVLAHGNHGLVMGDAHAQGQERVDVAFLLDGLRSWLDRAKRRDALLAPPLDGADKLLCFAGVERVGKEQLDEADIA